MWTHPDYRSERVTEAELENVERRLGTLLPSDYRDAVLESGLPRPTIELLNAICDRELDIHDVSEFLGPSEIVEVTQAWRDVGLSEELFAFATDCTGNLFCFPSDPTGADSLQPVFFWDHDSKRADTIAPSFSKWIEDFCRVTTN